MRWSAGVQDRIWAVFVIHNMQGARDDSNQP